MIVAWTDQMRENQLTIHSRWDDLSATPSVPLLALLQRFRSYWIVFLVSSNKRSTLPKSRNSPDNAVDSRFDPAPKENWVIPWTRNVIECRKRGYIVVGKLRFQAQRVLGSPCDRTFGCQRSFRGYSSYRPFLCTPTSIIWNPLSPDTARYARYGMKSQSQLSSVYIRTCEFCREYRQSIWIYWNWVTYYWNLSPFPTAVGNSLVEGEATGLKGNFYYYGCVLLLKPSRRPSVAASTHA